MAGLFTTAFGSNPDALSLQLLGRFRRVSPVAPRPREGRLTEPTAGAPPWPRERVLCPFCDIRAAPRNVRWLKIKNSDYSQKAEATCSTRRRAGGTSENPGLQGLLELVGGLLLALGLFTRTVAFILAGEMEVAGFVTATLSSTH